MKVKMFLRKNASIILLYLIVIVLVLPLSVVPLKLSSIDDDYCFSAVFIEEGITAFSRVFDHLFLSRDIDTAAKVKSLFIDLGIGIAAYFPLVFNIAALRTNAKNSAKANLVLSIVDCGYFLIALTFMLWNYLAYLLFLAAVLYLIDSLFKYKAGRKEVHQ